jgi:hypothetical protein
VPRPAEADIGALLESLHKAGIAFIVVGGAAAVLHGAPLPTCVLDIVPARDPANLDRWASALAALDAILREPGHSILPLERHHLDGDGQLQLRTTLGPLDVLLRLHDGADYDALRPVSVVQTSGGLSIEILDLPRLVEVKSSTGRTKDRLAVPVLLALLRERERRREE